MAGNVGRLIYRANALFWGAVVTVLLGVLTLISIPLALLYRPLRWIMGSPHEDTVAPEVLEEYEQIMRALRAGDPAQLKTIAAHSPSFPGGSDGFVGRPWFINAVDGGSVASVRWMLDAGLDPDLSDDEGATPLTSAVQRDDDAALEMVDAILDAGADINAPDAVGRTPLHEAAAFGSAQIVTLLLDRGADPGRYDTDYAPVRPWEVAENANRPEIAELIRSRHGARS